MKFKRILKGFLTAVGILILLAAIAVGGYILYKSYEQRQQVPKEVLLNALRMPSGGRSLQFCVHPSR